MYPYIIPFLFYVLSIPLINFGNWIILRFAVLSLLILALWKFYSFKLKFELFPLFIGVIIFLVWILTEGHYPLIGATYFEPRDTILLIVRVLSFVAITPVIEEFFVRYFLARILIQNDWKKIQLGKFIPATFIITTLFFGFSHNRWLPGLIAGALLNYLIMKKKNMGSVILAHSFANILLVIYIVYTKSWGF